jgi:hypothetical protein
MAKLIKQEGDFTYWDDGAKRYAKGNSLGKTPGALAERNAKYQDKAIEALAQLSPKQAQALKRRKNGHAIGAALADVRQGKQTERKRLAQFEAEAGLLRAGLSLSPLSPKLPAEAWGFIVERQAEAAMSPEMSHSVRAAEFVGRATDYLHQDKSGSVQALQVNVHLDGGAAGRLVELGLLGSDTDDVVDGEARDAPDDDETETDPPPTTSGTTW